MVEEEKNKSPLQKKISRREFLKKAGMTGAGALVGGSLLGSFLYPQFQKESNEAVGKEEISFYGKHQAGITTYMQKNIYFVVLDLASTKREEVIKLFKDWTAYTEQLMQGQKVTKESSNAYLPPKDTGEALGLNPYRLTVTFGISRSFLKKLKLKDKEMALFKDFPAFSGQQLEEQYTGGDIVIQACADDEQVAFHAARNLIRVGRGVVTMKWSQSGFAAIGDRKETPRNLFGFKDGTANATKEEEFDDVIWYNHKDWLQGGTFMAVRRIRMHLETWDRTNLNEQEKTFGRYKESGAPFGKKNEFDDFKWDEKDENGDYIMPIDSHVSLANRTGVKLFRRSYSYADGINDKTGQFEAGLLFISFQKDPENFVTVQKSLGSVDKLNEYITHIGSGLFACFGGIEKGGYIGQKLFE
ncbi:iron uptake transporter deferrochelatase/peroxidase subunit [Streptococcus macacae]|uniref:Deferrochelatase n=1 Tax=Streptococcus macacae NCTC 11558 TaxID=764298 RepID=G5JVH7_9STRE|nr:iron uptake transporter deferrochelatase/peroxidase subunit [Streptococcus macacae]EHJ51885.1 Tat-translocated enzyme [Streptococcus macacae NCTC 11558]SUN78572.1 Iron-dependent peroxidase [Streptococcus macacae NCTC 11558]